MPSICVVAARTFLASLAWLGPVALAETQPVERQGTFDGNWQLVGEAKTVETGGESVILLRASGPVSVTGSGGMKTSFTSECVGASDGETGGAGRCVWTDEDGDQLFLSLAGEIIGPAGTFRETRGSVTGGTGKYVGLEGDYVADWLFVPSQLEKGKVSAHGTKLKGSWRRH